jgi:hypothetical protein
VNRRDFVKLSAAAVLAPSLPVVQAISAVPVAPLLGDEMDLAEIMHSGFIVDDRVTFTWFFEDEVIRETWIDGILASRQKLRVEPTGENEDGFTHCYVPDGDLEVLDAKEVSP